MGGDCPAIAEEAKEARFSAAAGRTCLSPKLISMRPQQKQGGAWCWKQVEIVRILNADGLWIDL
eukprot:49642-Chlamydomonas_euryale.AAC.2